MQHLSRAAARTLLRTQGRSLTPFHNTARLQSVIQRPLHNLARSVYGVGPMHIKPSFVNAAGAHGVNLNLWGRALSFSTASKELDNSALLSAIKRIQTGPPDHNADVNLFHEMQKATFVVPVYSKPDANTSDVDGSGFVLNEATTYNLPSFTDPNGLAYLPVFLSFEDFATTVPDDAKENIDVVYLAAPELWNLALGSAKPPSPDGAPPEGPSGFAYIVLNPATTNFPIARHHMEALREQAPPGTETRTVEAGTRMLFGTPATPMAEVESNLLTEICANNAAILEAYIPQMAVMGAKDPEPPKQVLAILVDDAKGDTTAEVVSTITAEFKCQLEAGAFIDVLPLTNAESDLIERLRGMDGIRIK